MPGAPSKSFDDRRIWVHPVFWARYYGIYLEGLRRVFPERKLAVNGGPFTGWIGPRDAMVIIVGGRTPLRLYFEANDVASINGRELRWCDAYGVVNLDPEGIADLPPRAARKIVPLGPSFAIRLWSPPRALLGASIDLPKAAREGLPRHSWRRYIGDRRGQARRPPLSAYAPVPTDPDYVFFASTWWPDSESELNEARRHFIESCLGNRDIRFEGGFDERGGSHGLPSRLLLSRRLSSGEYLERTARSALVFNTPAVHGCHGWKLGEYLALGKAIISLPLKRALPAPLRHGEHIHFVNEPGEIDGAVSDLMGDPAYRVHLGNGARRYWDEHLAPEMMIRKMLALAEGLVEDRDPRTLQPPPR